MVDEFKEPRLAINKVYTKTGDKGHTSLVSGRRVSKDHIRIKAYGEIDELNAHIGLANVLLSQLGASDEVAWLGKALVRVQHELFNLGSVLATPKENIGPNQPQILDRDVTRLEREIDTCNNDLSPLRSFILPGGSMLNTQFHVCRTVCRRAERSMVELDREEGIPEPGIRYINRLSDALFVWSRWANLISGNDETLWDPNH